MKKIESILNNAIIELGMSEEDVKVITSNRPDLCDYQYEGVFKLAKKYQQAPVAIGDSITEKINQLDNFSTYFKKVEFVKPGFINFTLSDSFINNKIREIINDENLGIISNYNDLYFLDFGGPNIAKPLHVGHLRTAILGESLKRILEVKGSKTISDVHLGDFGLQIGQVIYGILSDGLGKDEITLQYLEETYPKISALCKEDEDVLETCRKIVKDLQDGKPEYQELWKIICKLSGDDIKRIYKYLDVSFDLWQGESDSFQYIEAVENHLKGKNLLQASQGALIVEVQKETDQKEMPPLIFQKSNGAYLYGTTDLATIYERVTKYNPNYMLYIVDSRQEMHFNQVFRVCEKSNLSPNTKLEFLGNGTINGLDGKPYKTRSGDAPKLDDLFNQIKEIFINTKESNKNMSLEDIDKIVNAIIKFADLQNNLERDYIFDISKFSDVTGKTGPYILYTALRIEKIIETNRLNNELTNTIYNDSDRNLRLEILKLNSFIDKAYTERRPHYVADYLYNLSVVVNTFYQNNYLNNLDDEINKNDWVIILNLTNKIIRKLLYLLAIEVPTIM